MAKATKKKPIIPVLPLNSGELKTWLAKQPAYMKQWVKSSGFSANPQSVCLLPGEDGKLVKVLAGVEKPLHIWSLAHLPSQLPKGRYSIESRLKKDVVTQLALGWQLGSYDYTEFKKSSSSAAVLEIPAGCDKLAVKHANNGITLARELINTPPNVMGPEALASACKKLARQYDASCKIIVGDALLKQNYPAVHTVGRACEQAPRLADIRWGNAKHPKITLVGKGVTFDTGGLTLKPLSGMRLMKKDMGGAANVLGLAAMV